MRFTSLRSLRAFAFTAAVLLLAASQVRAQSAAAAPQRPKITGISHVGYFVSDLPKAVAFWHEFLGYEQVHHDLKEGRQRH